MQALSLQRMYVGMVVGSRADKTVQRPYTARRMLSGGSVSAAAYGITNAMTPSNNSTPAAISVQREADACRAAS